MTSCMQADLVGHPESERQSKQAFISLIERQQCTVPDTSAVESNQQERYLVALQCQSVDSVSKTLAIQTYGASF